MNETRNALRKSLIKSYGRKKPEHHCTSTRVAASTATSKFSYPHLSQALFICDIFHKYLRHFLFISADMFHLRAFSICEDLSSATFFIYISAEHFHLRESEHSKKRIENKLIKQLIFFNSNLHLTFNFSYQNR